MASLVAPSLSVARTVTVCNPSLAKGQSASYGALLRLAKLSPLAKISTDTTVPSLSVALALTFSVAPTLTPKPALGEVITTSGAVFGGSTVTLTTSEIVSAPRLSTATAVSKCSPSVAAAHSISYGAVSSTPNVVAPLKNNTFTTLPSASAASALSARLLPCLITVPEAGALSVTVGAWFAVTNRPNFAPRYPFTPSCSVLLSARL